MYETGNRLRDEVRAIRSDDFLGLKGSSKRVIREYARGSQSSAPSLVTCGHRAAVVYESYGVRAAFIG